MPKNPVNQWFLAAPVHFAAGNWCRRGRIFRSCSPDAAQRAALRGVVRC
jgi:hypothetical protein